MRPILWTFIPLEKIWEYDFWIWIPSSEIDSIIKYSNDLNDIALQENTSDKKRFSSKESLEKWYNYEWRYVFSIISNEWKIAWFCQARPSKKPIVVKVVNEDIYNKIKENNIHTCGIRLYPNFRWQKLAWPTLELLSKYYWRFYPNNIISIDIDKQNIVSQKSFEKLWYEFIWYWENQKTVESSEKPRMIYIKFHTNHK